ncbi:TetR-like C-terminal domain-containing protein [Mammaliicoccus sp. Dog046]|uniref:TetR/AcrR family transcriptional regulator n=1 Tax=Mammaliicoccus sp. Dog046 TaxID=3034233 RepID=UPI002B2588C1|nr:TetR-like C-terminal domain-containing protein [Mammaliicoccus sp. Dog046]WQK85129.1 TetR-like C-terminal domain-containing protein [Mammaliicoccus sp. Dog046]
MAEDRRVRKSKNAIKKAFIELLKENRIEKITIQEISDLADVNRGTFYLNYEDKYALLDEMENEQIEKIRGMVDISKMALDQTSTASFIDDFAKKIIGKVITHIDDNIDFYKVILTLERKSKIENQFSVFVRNNLEFLIDEGEDVFGIPEEYYLSYITGSMISMIKYWVNDENRVSVDELVNYSATIAGTGPLTIMRKLVDKKFNRD